MSISLPGDQRDSSPPMLDSAVPILVVDDNEAKRLAMRAVLAPLGYAIVEADSGLAGLRCLMAQDFAVILLDVRMPVMDGFETAALIRLRPQSEMTPIIFITAHEADEITTDRYAEGAVDFIAAPINPDELRAKISVFANLFIRAEALATQAQQVRASADQLSLLTEAAPIGIFQTDAQDRYSYTNPRWTEITGISSADALGREWDVFVDRDQRVALAAALSVDGANGADFCQRFDIRIPGSGSKIVMVTSTAIKDDAGAITGWVGTLADITAVTVAEAAMTAATDQATAASVLKSDFLANMSHEIRTPMNGVLGMTELLLDTDLDVRQRDYALTVRNSGEALLTVVNDILDFSKIETGKLEIEDVSFSVRTIIQDVLGLLEGSARGNGLALMACVEDSVPPSVRGDPGRLRQVLTNLIGNAIKFTETGEVTVRASAGATAESGSVVRFEVSDTGVGIAQDKLVTIFEPFVQADTSTSRKYGGTGLGLAISSQLVALMRGEVGVSSRPGVGTTFWFTIGVDDQSDAAFTGSTRARRPSRPPVEDPGVLLSLIAPSRPDDIEKEHLRLLLAEDNLVNQKVAVAMLLGAGHQVDTAITGAQAVEAALGQQYDAILMDCQMPEMNGYEATAAIRAHEGATGQHTPIIALTAGARSEDRERCLAEDMDYYLAKPFSKGALLAVVRESMSRLGTA